MLTLDNPAVALIGVSPYSGTDVLGDALALMEVAAEKCENQADLSSAEAACIATRSAWTAIYRFGLFNEAAIDRHKLLKVKELMEKCLSFFPDDCELMNSSIRAKAYSRNIALRIGFLKAYLRGGLQAVDPLLEDALKSTRAGGN